MSIKYFILLALPLLFYSCKPNRVEKQDYRITYGRVGNVYPGDDIKSTKQHLSNFKCVPSPENWKNENSGLNNYDFYDKDERVLHISTIQGKVFKIEVHSNKFKTDNNMMVGQSMGQLMNVKRNMQWYYENDPTKMPIKTFQHHENFNDSCYYLTFGNSTYNPSNLNKHGKLLKIVIH